MRRAWPKPTIASASCWGNRAGREALLQFEQAVHLNPALFDAQYHLGATRWWTRDFAGALPALQAAVTLRPDHAEARYYLGLTLQSRGLLEPAIEAAEGRGAAEPAARRRAGPSRYRARGDSAISTARSRQLEAAVRIDPSAFDARNSLGLALSQRGSR